MIPAVSYEKIDDEGLHVTIGGERQLLAVDQVVICAGQEPRRELADPLRAAGKTVHLIGGCDVAAELDARRAIAGALNWRWRFSPVPGAARCAFPATTIIPHASPAKATAASRGNRDKNQRCLRTLVAFKMTNLLFVAIVVQLPNARFSLRK